MGSLAVIAIKPTTNAFFAKKSPNFDMFIKLSHLVISL